MYANISQTLQAWVMVSNRSPICSIDFHYCWRCWVTFNVISATVALLTRVQRIRNWSIYQLAYQLRENRTWAITLLVVT